MKNLNKEIKIIRTIFISATIIILIIGLFFSYLIADLDDAPGVIFVGGAITLACTLMVYGIGEIIIQLKKNNALLSDIKKQMINKNNS